MTIAIGASLDCWSSGDLAAIGGSITVEECLGAARDLGLEGVELGAKVPRQATVLAPILESFNLELVGVAYVTLLLERDADTEFEAAAAHCKLLRDLGARVFIATEGARSVRGNRSAPLSTRPVMKEGDCDLFNKRLTRFAAMLQDEGLQLVYHHGMGTVVQTGAEIDRLIAGTGPAVHLLLDTGHAICGGDDPGRLVAAHRDRIGLVHCTDVRMDVKAKAEAGDWSYLDSVMAGVFTLPGDGGVDFVSVFRELKGYSGWMVLAAERDPEKVPPQEYVALGVASMKRSLTQAGLVVKGG